jgi:hypothetical protein
MNFVLWILSVLAGGTLAGVLLAAAGWLARNWILTRLKASVQHEFDQKLEQLRSDLRRSEDALRDVRSTGLQALAAKETARDARRIEGIEAVWQATLECKKHSGVAASLAVMNYDEVCNRIAAEPKLQQAFQITLQDADPLHLRDAKILRGETARPWVSPLLWALHTAYRTSVAYANAIAHTLKLGFDPRRFLSSERIYEVVAAALPDQAQSLKPFRPLLIPTTLELLETKLLIAIVDELNGAEPTMAALEQAKRIAKAAASANVEIVAASSSASTPL